ncbi:MAG: hypothetical protein HY711_00525 [Candidatus Melainabacteria bacterium]|nr:hypothetical protein [Candidatus Melainabacteria bacterium]
MSTSAKRNPDKKIPPTNLLGVGESTWIAEVSHELRLPIANLKLLVETLLDGAMDDAEVAEAMLKKAYEEVERLNSLVHNLLTIEQVAQSRQHVMRQWSFLEEVAMYALGSTRAFAQDKGVEVKVQIKSGWQVFANRSHLDQLLVNLVENAIKFTPAGGSVLVKSGDKPGSFAVIDSGIGMAAHEIPKIFQRFYRIDRTQSRGSTGLGLSIVKHIADLHGAKINVVSQEGNGSTFFIEFPGPP